MTLIALLGSAMAVAAAAVAARAETVQPMNPVPIVEWKIEADGRPRDPFATGDDAVWFVGQAGDYIGRLTPSTGAVQIRPLEDEPGPHNLIVGSDGFVWYDGNLSGYIGRYDPATDLIERIPMPDRAARDPHTLVFDAGERNIWFSVQGGNLVGRLALADRSVVLIPVETDRARPYGIKVGPDAAVWIALLGTNRLASVNPQTLDIVEHEIPADDARPRRLEITPSGEVWYSDYERGAVGRFDPRSGRFDEWLLPGGTDSAPYATALDATGVLWVVETGSQPNRLIGFDTAALKVVSITPIPSGGGTVRNMHYLAAANEVWFGADTATLGRADVRRR